MTKAEASVQELVGMIERGELCLPLVPVSRHAFGQAAQLVRNVSSGLRSGDSLHLSMAIEAGAASIATADVTLEKNVRLKGLAVNRF